MAHRLALDFSRLMLEVRHLRLVRAILDHGSVTRAADALHLSQSALSHQLVNFEADLGVKLFDRVGRRMLPTAAGARLADAAERVLTQLYEVERDIARTSEDDRTPLRVAATCPSSYGWLASNLAKFSAAQPELDLQVSLHPGARETAMLMDDVADLVVTSHPVAGASIECRRLFALEAVALLSKTHPVLARRTAATRAAIHWSDLADSTLLIHELPREDEARLRQTIRAAAAGGGRVPREPRIRRVRLTEAIAELARTGHGIGVIARPVAGVPAVQDGLVMRPLRPRYDRPFFAIWSKGNRRALPLEAVARSLMGAISSTSSVTNLQRSRAS